MTIGVLKEGDSENRVVLLPEHVANLVKKEFQVHVEKGAGLAAFVSDGSYTEAGATMQSRAEILKGVDMIFSINPPSEAIPKGKILISILGPLSNKTVVDRLAKEGVTSYSLDMIPRSTRAQAVDVLSSMATVAGYKSVLVAAGAIPTDVAPGCGGVSLDTGTLTFAQPVTNNRAGNGLQIFPGSVPIFRNDTLIGGIGVSGDGVDQDDMIAFLGVHNAGLALANGIGNAPPDRRADNLTPQGTRLRYVQCPQAPFLSSEADNVCDGK